MTEIVNNDISAEYKRWRNRAIKDMREGRQIRPFSTSLIPEDEHVRVYSALLQCKTIEEVRTTFHVVRTRGMKLPEQATKEREGQDKRHYLKFLTQQ